MKLPAIIIKMKRKKKSSGYYYIAYYKRVDGTTSFFKGSRKERDNFGDILRSAKKHRERIWKFERIRVPIYIVKNGQIVEVI